MFLKENNSIDSLINQYKKSQNNESNKTEIVVINNNQIDLDEKETLSLSKYGFKNIYIIDQEDIVKINSLGAINRKNISGYVRNELIGLVLRNNKQL